MSTLTTQELQQQYIAYFGRPGDPQGIEYWLNESDIKTAKEFALKISAQDEYSKGIGAEPVADQVNALYVNLFGRSADADGLIYWTNQVTKGVLSLGNLAYDLIVAAGNPIEGNEGQAALDAAALTKKTAAAQLFTDNVKAGGFILDYDNEEAFAVARSFVTTVQADSQFTVDQLTTFTQAQVVAMSNASKAAAATAATPTAALSVVEQAQLQAAQAQTAAAQAELAVASQAAAEAAAAKAEAAAAAEEAKNAPTAYKLTKTTDTLVGQGGDDTFSGVIQAATADGTTAFPGDAIDGGDGNDTLTISVAGANPNLADYPLNAVTLDNVEKVLISNFESTDTADPAENFNIFDAGLWTGVNVVGANASSLTGDTTFRALKNFVDAEMRNGEGSLVIDYSGQQSVAGEEDVQNLTLSGTTAGNFIANKIETINVTTELIKSTLTSIESDRLTKLTVAGDQDLTVTATGLSWYNPQSTTAIDGTVDASTATGKISLHVGGSDATLSVTGGSGDDTFNFAGRLEKNDVVDGGDGTDTIAMDRQVDALTTEFANVTNIEKFAVNTSDANTSIDVSKLPSSVTTLQFDLNDQIAGAAAVTIDAVVDKVPDGTTFNLKKTTRDNVDFVANNGSNLTVTELSDTTSNSINIVLDAVNSRADSAGGGWSEVFIGNYETIGLESKRDKNGLITHNELGTLTASNATDITVTGDADLTIGSVTGTKLKTFDASGITGKVNLTSSATGATGTTFKGPNAQTTFNLGTTLDYLDTVEGGTNGKDVLTATLTDKTATTGKLKISGIETIDIDTVNSANTLDVSGITGATTLLVTSGVQTITGFDLASGLILKADDITAGQVGNATFKVTPSDASGTDDSITIARSLTDDNNGLNAVDIEGVETLNLVLADSDTDNAANDNSVWNLSKFKGNSIIVTQGANDTGEVDAQLGTLYKTVTLVDTSAMKGDQSATAAVDALAAVTFKGAGGDVASFTGTEWNDTFVIGKSANVVHVLSGGAGAADANGTDTATVSVTTNWTNPSGIATEVLNLDVDPGKDIVLAAAGFNAATTTINITGGNSLSEFENISNDQIATTVEKIDASAFGGNVKIEFTNNNFDNTVELIGTGSTTDDVVAHYTTDNVVFKPKATDIYEFVLSTALGGTGSTTVNLGDTTGIKKATVTLDTDDTLILDKLDGQSIKLVGGLGDAILNPKLADDSGSADTLTIEVKGANANAIAGTTRINATDIETVTIKSTGPVGGEEISLAGLAMDASNKTMTLKITGNDPLSINGLGVDVDTIDASGMTDGGFMQVAGGRTRTKSSTYTGSSSNDAFIMSNKDDVIDGGGHDASSTGDRLVLDNNMELLLGGIEVDLTKSDDVLITYNALGNTSAQSNFESVDISRVVANQFGSFITAAKTGSYIQGLDTNTSSRDVILGGDGDDTIWGGNGPDKITPGAGINTIIFDGTAELDDGENYISGTGTDTFSITTTTDFTSTSAGAKGLRVDGGTLGNTAITGLDGISVGEGQTATFHPDQINAMTLVLDGVAGNAAETIQTTLVDGGDTFTAANFTNVAGASTPVLSITGGNGADTITGSADADLLEIINPGTGTVNDTVALGAASTELKGMAVAGTSTVKTWTTAGASIAALAADDTVAITAGTIDTVTGFTAGAAGGDSIDVAGTTIINLVGVAQDANLATGTNYVAYGSYASNTFTVKAAFHSTNSNDALLYVGDSGALTMINATGYVLFTDLNAAFVAADLV